MRRGAVRSARINSIAVSRGFWSRVCRTAAHSAWSAPALCSASARWPRKRAASASSSSSDSHATAPGSRALSCACHCASSVVFPKPAGASNSVSGRACASSNAASSASRTTASARGNGGSSLPASSQSGMTRSRDGDGRGVSSATGLSMRRRRPYQASAACRLDTLQIVVNQRQCSAITGLGDDGAAAASRVPTQRHSVTGTRSRTSCTTHRLALPAAANETREPHSQAHRQIR